MQFLFDTRNEFDPDRVSRISCAFAAALHAVSEDDCTDLPAHAIRRLIASGIIKAAKAGENDVDGLKRAGLRALNETFAAESPGLEGAASPRAAGCSGLAWGALGR